MTDVERRIRADELGTYLRGKMGLVVGPGVTINPGIMAELSSHLASEFGVERRESFLETGERCLEGSVPEDGLRDRIRQFFAAQKAAPGLAQLAKARWSAVLSFALDTFLEDKLQREAERRFPRHPITVLDHGRQPAPPRSTPVFKLLGRTDRDTFAYTNAHYAMRRASWWRSAVRDYADLQDDQERAAHQTSTFARRQVSPEGPVHRFGQSFRSSRTGQVASQRTKTPPGVAGRVGAGHSPTVREPASVAGRAGRPPAIGRPAHLFAGTYADAAAPTRPRLRSAGDRPR